MPKAGPETIANLSSTSFAFPLISLIALLHIRDALAAAITFLFIYENNISIHILSNNTMSFITYKDFGYKNNRIKVIYSK